MKKQHDTNTAFRHIPNEYDSFGLGRDDPVWPRYVTEATKWDAQLVEGWHKGMDVILLPISIVFAALFSAIVTAFLLESHKLLQVDYEERIASGIPTMIEILQAIATNQTLSTIVNTTNPDEFKPTNTVVAINASWFLSLTLSISVALLAMLVKQWGEGYRHGHDLSPPCIQARVRQARYDKLKRWRTEDIALALPVLMHASLGTRRCWALCCAIFHRIFASDYENEPSQATLSLKCQQKERETSENTIPDKLTVRALEWLIGHSKETETIDIAIGAISSTILKAQIHKHLAQDSLITLLAQKFTAIFNGTLDGEKYDPNAIDGAQLEKAALYGRALANTIRHIQIRAVSNRDIRDQRSTMQKIPDYYGQTVRISLIGDQVKAVERGLFLIASSEEPKIAGSGVTCLSAWYTSTNREAQSRDKWKAMLTRLILLLSNNNHRARLRPQSVTQGPIPNDQSVQVEGGESEVREEYHTLTEALESEQLDPRDSMPHGQSVQVEGKENAVLEDNRTPAMVLESDELDRIVHTLLLELAHWRWDLSKQERREILIPLIKLFNPRLGLLNGPSQPGMSAILAVFAILFHDHQGLSTEMFSPTDGNWIDIPDLGPGDSPDFVQSMHREIDSKDIQTGSKHRSNLARHAARTCQKDDQYMREHANALLFFGLAGLLDSLSILGLAELAEEIVGVITAQLNVMSGTFPSGPILLPHILPPTIDVRVFMADAITRSLSPSPFKGHLHPFSEQGKARLLECLWDKSYIWSDYGHQFLMPITQLLHTAQSEELRDQCLTALSEYCFMNSNPSQPSSPHYGMDWRFFFSLDVPYRLAQIMKENGSLRSKTVATFDLIMQMIPKDSLNPGSDASNRISAVLSRLAIDDLLSTFAEAALDRRGYSHVQTWRDQLIDLPGWLDSTKAHNSEIIKEELRRFRTESIKKPGLMTTMALGLGDKL